MLGPNPLAFATDGEEMKTLGIEVMGSASSVIDTMLLAVYHRADLAGDLTLLIRMDQGNGCPVGAEDPVLLLRGFEPRPHAENGEPGGDRLSDFGLVGTDLAAEDDRVDAVQAGGGSRDLLAGTQAENVEGE